MKFAIIVLTVVVSAISIVNSNVCKKMGSTCKNCKERAFCVRIYDDWLEYPLTECDEGFACDDATGDCIESNATCFKAVDSKDFECIMEGIFPDPFDCSHFYLCNMQDDELTKIELSCPSEKLYSAKTQRCSSSEMESTCTKSNCKSSGQVTAWPDDDNIYYFCLPDTDNNLYPTMLRCPQNERFNGTNCVEKCQTGSTELSNTPANPPNVPVQSPATENSDNEWNTREPWIFTTTIRPSEIFRCTRKGLIPHPTNCRKYYHCDTYLSAIVYDCPQDSYFNSYFGLCLKGTC